MSAAIGPLSVSISLSAEGSGSQYGTRSNSDEGLWIEMMRAAGLSVHDTAGYLDRHRRELSLGVLNRPGHEWQE